MCVLLHLLICTVLRAHIIVVEALYKINYYYYYYDEQKKLRVDVESEIAPNHDLLKSQ